MTKKTLDHAALKRLMDESYVMQQAAALLEGDTLSDEESAAYSAGFDGEQYKGAWTPLLAALWSLGSNEGKAWRAECAAVAKAEGIACGYYR